MVVGLGWKRLALFGQGGAARDVVAVGVQVLDVARDPYAFGVVPGPGADTVPCVDRALAPDVRDAQVRTPVPIAGAGCRRQHLAVRVSPPDPSQVRTLAAADARYEEGHSCRPPFGSPLRED